MGSRPWNSCFAPEKANKGLAWRQALEGNPGKHVSRYFYPDINEENRLINGAGREGQGGLFLLLDDSGERANPQIP